MAEPWQCPQCRVWLAPSVSEHRCDDGQGSAGATVTTIWPPPGGPTASTLSASTGTVTWTGTIITAQRGRPRDAMFPSATGRRLTDEQRLRLDPRIRSA